MKKWILAVIMAAMTVLSVQADTHEKVQLWEGGPYWATTNIGADNPEDYGLYFWWGDTTGYRPSSDGTFSFDFSGKNPVIYTFGRSIPKLQSAGWLTADKTLASAHDAAHVKWGGKWRMPTYQEIYDLWYSKCDWTWTTMNGVNGYVIRGKGSYASNSIFLPAAGRGIGTSLSTSTAGSQCHYWSSFPNQGSFEADILLFEEGFHGGLSTYRYYGLPVRPVQGFGEETYEEEAVVSFNANGGAGTMEAQSFEEGKEQKLSKNAYRKEGYVFQGWAVAANGEVVYKDEASITVDSDMTLYAVWDNPPLTLAAESADWIGGSIALRCVDADTSGAVHSYTLSFLADNGEWGTVEGAQGVAPSYWSNVDGTYLRIASLSDASFLTRLDGIKPVSYRVSDENGRVSEACVTRTRYGLFVGVGHYSAAYQARRKLQSGRVLSDLPGIADDTRRYANLANVRGGFTVTNLIETAATVNGVDGAFAEIAGKAKPGDICLFYVATHGDFDGNKAVIRLYDDDYSDAQLKNGVELLSGKDAAVVCILATCCSEALVRQSYPNVAVIAAANYQGSTTSLFDMILMDYGWRDGWAGTGDNLSFGDLASYVSSRYNAIFSGITFSFDGRSETWNVQVENNVLLSNISAGTRNATASQKPLPVVSNAEASQEDYRDKIEVSWDGDADADWYFVFCKDAGNVACEGFKPIVGKSGGKFHADFMASDYAYVERSSEDSPVSFAIRAFNGSGVSSTGSFRGWVSQKRQVVFDARGGTILPWLGLLPDDGKIDASLDKGTVLGSLPNANKDGVSCLYWYRKDGSRTEVATEQPEVTEDVVYYAWWESPTQEWFDRHTTITSVANGDIATAVAMPAANGCRTVGECYALGIDPEDPDDDLKISHFEMKDGKPVITLNHTEDGSGNSFTPRVKTLGKENLNDNDWVEVPESGNPSLRFFKVDVEMP